ncbi:hypothetical protein NIES4071_87400 [Calothrix sp. NIES-4071]|nr:hypothetical protein NIES4071_87400 [Calothrix sp. NIES-4071]BAZ63007.1 hypothetical protein NIES4105_87330 [Calothrix sp. NIES-4105]
MNEIINIEQAVLMNLRNLPNEKQQEVLDFVQFLVNKTKHVEQPINQTKAKMSLQDIAKLPLEERHKLIAPYVAAMAEDFLNDPELTEFSVLDGEDWENEHD